MQLKLETQQTEILQQRQQLIMAKAEIELLLQSSNSTQSSNSSGGQTTLGAANVDTGAEGVLTVC